MAMAELKTKKNDASVDAFLEGVQNEQRRHDSIRIREIMEDVTGCPAVMWGPSIVGFGSYHYVYASGREGDWMATGFSPRKNALTLYIMAGFDHYDDLMSRLGTYTTGKSCLYVKRLSDVDETILRELIQRSTTYLTTKYGS
jgi:hypothetical protein